MAPLLADDGEDRDTLARIHAYRRRKLLLHLHSDGADDWAEAFDI
jgi:hypothetical protein